jgi:hypothetical protein
MDSTDLLDPEILQQLVKIKIAKELSFSHNSSEFKQPLNRDISNPVIFLNSSYPQNFVPHEN